MTRALPPFWCWRWRLEAISLTSIIMVLGAPSDNAHVRLMACLGAVGLGCGACAGRVSLRLSVLSAAQNQDASGVGVSRHRQTRPLGFSVFLVRHRHDAQVSDVTTSSAQMRKVVLHSIGSFFYNTIILALAVNAAVTSAG